MAPRSNLDSPADNSAMVPRNRISAGDDVVFNGSPFYQSPHTRQQQQMLPLPPQTIQGAISNAQVANQNNRGGPTNMRQLAAFPPNLDSSTYAYQFLPSPTFGLDTPATDVNAAVYFTPKSVLNSHAVLQAAAAAMNRSGRPGHTYAQMAYNSPSLQPGRGRVAGHAHPPTPQQPMQQRFDLDQSGVTDAFKTLLQMHPRKSDCVPLRLAKDDIDKLTNVNFGHRVGNLRDALSADAAPATEFGLEKIAYAHEMYDKSMASSLQKLKAAMQDPAESVKVEARCVLAMYFAVLIHQHGVQKTGSAAGHEIDMTSTFSERAEKLVASARKDKLIALNIVDGKNLGDFAHAPTECLAMKIHHAKSNAIRKATLIATRLHNATGGANMAGSGVQGGAGNAHGTAPATQSGASSKKANPRKRANAVAGSEDNGRSGKKARSTVHPPKNSPPGAGVIAGDNRWQGVPYATPFQQAQNHDKNSSGAFSESVTYQFPNADTSYTNAHSISSVGMPDMNASMQQYDLNGSTHANTPHFDPETQLPGFRPDEQYGNAFSNTYSPIPNTTAGSIISSAPLDTSSPADLTTESNSYTTGSVTTPSYGAGENSVDDDDSFDDMTFHAGGWGIGQTGQGVDDGAPQGFVDGNIDTFAGSPGGGDAWPFDEVGDEEDRVLYDAMSNFNGNLVGNSGVQK